MLISNINNWPDKDLKRIIVTQYDMQGDVITRSLLDYQDDYIANNNQIISNEEIIQNIMRYTNENICEFHYIKNDFSLEIVKFQGIKMYGIGRFDEKMMEWNAESLQADFEIFEREFFKIARQLFAQITVKHLPKFVKKYYLKDFLNNMLNRFNKQK
jgi:hypothetical protein